MIESSRNQTFSSFFESKFLNQKVLMILVCFFDAREYILKCVCESEFVTLLFTHKFFNALEKWFGASGDAQICGDTMIHNAKEIEIYDVLEPRLASLELLDW